jgi:hypothetical protein
MYFPRMLDKVRLHARGELRENFAPISATGKPPTARAAIVCA